MEDPLEWLPEFLRDHWDQAVESLRSQGKLVSAPRPAIWGAHDPRSGGDVMAGVVVKVYESSDQVISRVTHGDKDRDLNQTYTLDVKRKTHDRNGAARKEAHQAVQVLVRILELYRSDPHEDWNRIEDVQSRTVENYGDYQQRVVTFTLHRYGEPMVAAVLQDRD